MDPRERQRLYWYVRQMSPGYASVPHISPIRVLEVTPKEDGEEQTCAVLRQRLLRSRVRDFTLDLRVLVYQFQFLMALVAPFTPADSDQRACVIHLLSADWVERLMPDLAARWRIRPPADLSQELDQFLMEV